MVEKETQIPKQIIERGPKWDLYTTNPSEIDDAVARKAWKEAYEEFVDELIESGRDFDMAPVPSGSLTRKTEL
jgi:hypothetical protein